MESKDFEISSSQANTWTNVYLSSLRPCAIHIKAMALEILMKVVTRAHLKKYTFELKLHLQRSMG